MELNELTAISPIDGRYRKKSEKLAEYFSEFGILKLRVKVEVEWLIAMVGKEGGFRKIWEEFSLEDAKWIKAKEEETRHDVKAVEYFIREGLGARAKGLGNFVHFGLTSEDINSLAYGLALDGANKEIVEPQLIELIEKLKQICIENGDTVMLARTHGQAAVATTLGKEMGNFLVRVVRLAGEIKGYRFEGKLNGAVGNFNALQLADPKTNWIKVSDKFIQGLGLEANHFTTQILPYDNWLGYFSKLKLLNYVLVGFCQDVWRYVSDDYFIQTVQEKEVGSSTMPQKINPIDFENGEGNLGLANSLIEFYERKLPISRLQRDLSDSTVRRTFGVALAHSLIGYQSIISGLEKVRPNNEKIERDLENHWEILAEGIQTVLRAEGQSEGFENLKKLTRGKKVTQELLHKYILGLKISKAARKKLLELTPKSYLGLAKELAKLAIN